METAIIQPAILARLQEACELAHKDYRDARSAIADALEIEDQGEVAFIMTGMMLLNAKPEIKPAEPIAFLRALKGAVAAWHALDHAVARREDYLCALDAAHQRVTVEDGREFIVAADGSRTILRDR